MPRIVGIDLGTTNSAIAVMDGNAPRIIPLADGSRLCPSVVGFTRNGERLVGQIARRQALASPERTISSIKRHMGTDFRVEIDDRRISPQEVSAYVLHKLKTDAEAFLGEPVTKAVITVPAYFSEPQRQATKEAGAIAGLEVVRIVNEPTAAALAYGLDREEIHHVLIWDLGGGTFDVSVLELGDGVFEVKATSGDTHLGGDDWDARLMSWIAQQFERENGFSLEQDRVARQRLKEAAERAKIELTARAQTNINLPFLSSGPDGPLHLDVDVTRSQMERLCGDLLERLAAPTRQALADAHLRASDLDRVLLVGGSTRMPAVQELARHMLGKEPFQGLDPDEAVALGAAIQGGVLNTDVTGVLLLDVTPLTLGIETLGGVMARIIERNTTIPTQGRQIFTTGADGQTSVKVRIFQGEHELVANNRFLASLQLSGIAPAYRGTPQIEVTFDIDVNGILHVQAAEKRTGRRQQIQIDHATGLAQAEIERLSRTLNT